MPAMPRYASTAPFQSSAITERPTTGVTGRVAPNLWGPIQLGNLPRPNLTSMFSKIVFTLAIASFASKGVPSESAHPRTVIVNLLLL